MNKPENVHDYSLQGAVLQATLENVGDRIVFALDSDCRYLAFNSRHRNEMLRVWKADIHPGDSILDYMTIPELQAEARRSFERALGGESFDELKEQTGSDIIYELRWRPIRSGSGMVLGVLVTVAEVTREDRLQMAVVKLNQLLEEAQNLAGMGGWEYEVASRRICWTPGVYQVYGVGLEFDPNDLDRCIGFYTPESSAILTAAFEKAVKSGEPYDLELQLNRGDGHTIWVRTMGKATFDAGRVVRVSGDIIDIDQLKRAQLETLSLNLELEERVRERTSRLEQRNRDLDSFTRAVSHELKAPLRAIAGFSRMVAEDYQGKLDAEGQRKLAVVYDNASTLDRMLSEILSLARIGKTRLACSRIDMKAMAVAMYHEVATPGDLREVQLDISSLPDCSADPILFRKVWGRILDNALKFSRGQEKRIVSIYADSTDLETTYYIKDTGVGFNQAYADRLFKPFERLHPHDEFKGTGIGLATVNRIVELHGGKVGATSGKDKGSLFWFTLPKAALSNAGGIPHAS